MMIQEWQNLSDTYLGEYGSRAASFGLKSYLDKMFPFLETPIALAATEQHLMFLKSWERLT